MKKKTMFCLLLVVVGLLVSCTALAVSSLEYKGAARGDAVLSGPGELTFDIMIINSGDEDMPGPVKLYYPDMFPVEKFGSPVLAAGESKTWEGTWKVTQKELEAGYVGFIVERTEKDPETGELTTKMARIKLKVIYNALEDGTTEDNLSNFGAEQVTEIAEHRLVINDEGKLLSEEEKNSVTEAMRQVQAFADVGFMTYPAGGSTQNSAEKVREWGEQTFGVDSNFVAFIIDMTKRHLDIYAAPSCAKILTADIENSIADKVYKKATLGKYADCAVETFGLIREALAKGENQTDEFIFRGKIKWGMSEEEVVALEGEPTLKSQADLYTAVEYADVPISKYKGRLSYTFLQNRLALSFYDIFDADKETFDYIRKALKVVYGDESEADRAELLVCANKIREDKLPDNSLLNYSLAKWEKSDGTVIYLLHDSKDLVGIMYFSPDYMNWTPEEEVNVTGL